MDLLCALFTRNKTQPDPTILNTKDVEDAKQTSQMNFPRKFIAKKLHSRAREPSIVYSG